MRDQDINNVILILKRDVKKLKMPDDVEGLLESPGVSRKTANLVVKPRFN
jgi:endonuclease III